jgi:hypothetical protein
MVESVAEGKTLRDVARLLRVSDSTMQTVKQKLRTRILEFMGSDILIQILRSPQWRHCLDATKEKMPCRQERRQ